MGISIIVLALRSGSMGEAAGAETGAKATGAGAGALDVIPADLGVSTVAPPDSGRRAPVVWRSLGDDGKEGEPLFNFSPHFMQTETSRGFL